MAFSIDKHLIIRALEFYARHNDDADLGSKMWTARRIEDELKKLKEPITAHDLMSKHGGEWLGFVHDRLKWDACNGDSVVWGSDDVLHMRRTLTPLYFEEFGATVAALAINEAFARKT